MGERKVVNKWYPPDFDPSKIKRNRRPRDQQVKIRVMIPFSMRCTTCGEYMYQGKKFNARKETVDGDSYLGIKIFRFYIKCTRCSSEITFKTDPKNSDYACEHGAKRNFEPWRESDEVQEEAAEKEKEEAGDVMKALEARTLDSKKEMDILDALDEIKSLNARNATVDTETQLQMLREVHAEMDKKSQMLEEEEEALVKSIEFKNSANYVKRIEDDGIEDPVAVVLDMAQKASESSKDSGKETSSINNIISSSVKKNTGGGKTVVQLTLNTGKKRSSSGDTGNGDEKEKKPKKVGVLPGFEEYGQPAEPNKKQKKKKTSLVGY